MEPKAADKPGSLAGPEPTYNIKEPSPRDKCEALVPIPKKGSSTVSTLCLHLGCLLGRPSSQATPRLGGLHSPCQEQATVSRYRACLEGRAHISSHHDHKGHQILLTLKFLPPPGLQIMFTTQCSHSDITHQTLRIPPRGQPSVWPTHQTH